MATMPKRRKSKDNPYNLDYNDNDRIYTVSFIDNKQEIHKVEVSEKVFEAFNKFELEDISQLHKMDKHIDNRRIDGTDDYSEIVLFHNTTNISKSVDEEVEEKLLFEELRDAINKLSDIQKRRIIMYYFDNLTLKEIAEKEQCSIMSVKDSLDNAICKLEKNLKNLKN